MGRSRVGLAWGLSVAVALCLGVLAGRGTLRDSASASVAPRPVFYTVHNGAVGSVFRFSATASWPVVDKVGNQANGVVTSVAVHPGQSVKVGDVLYSVDLRPTVVAQGSVPSFRTLSVGSTGADVAQLERLLAADGLYWGVVGDDFTAETQAAVKAWQTQVGVKADGVVEPGDVLYLPTLPARVRLSGLTQGETVAAGQGSVEVLGSTPTFAINLNEDQQDLVPLSASVSLDASGHTWRAHISSSRTTPAGGLILSLAGQGGQPVCGSQCATLSAAGARLFPAEITVVPRRAGPKVPVAAVQTSASGSTYVLTQAGRKIPVRVLASANGESIVSGVSAGTRVELFR